MWVISCLSNICGGCALRVISCLCDTCRGVHCGPSVVCVIYVGEGGVIIVGHLLFVKYRWGVYIVGHLLFV